MSEFMIFLKQSSISYKQVDVKQENLVEKPVSHVTDSLCVPLKFCGVMQILLFIDLMLLNGVRFDSMNFPFVLSLKFLKFSFLRFLDLLVMYI